LERFRNAGESRTYETLGHPRRKIAMMGKKLQHPDEVRVRRYDGFAQCDVIVSFRGREMILELADYNHAVKWAQMEAKVYKINLEL
jgi:hypothetical protein